MLRAQKDQVRFTLPVLSTNTNLVCSRPQLQMNKFLKLDEEIVCNLSEDISRIPSATRSTMRHLTTRHGEISQWQAQMSQSIGQVDREISAMEQVKDTAEARLQEKQLYCQLMSDCVSVSNSLSSAVLRNDCVFTQLKTEERLTNEIKEMLQKQICILLNKLSSLKEIRAQLLADFQDKGEAIKLTTKCITRDFNGTKSRFPADQNKPNHVSYDKWLSRCKDLKLTAENLIKDSSLFRGDLRFTLASQKNAYESQCRKTRDALRKKINELNRIQDTLIWERQQIKDEISDLNTDINKAQGQMRNCDSKLNQVTHRLNLLNQRPGHELCLDHPYFSLSLEKHDLAKIATGLPSVLQRSQQDLEVAHRRLMILENKLSKNAQALDVEQRCQTLHQSFLPALNTTVILANKPRFCTSMARPSALSYFQ
ncbi:Tektin-2 [Larimichthys crocea]|uniref:Tektin n=1 Tax=Larimichthys crocea TaxID=215358 RepID=A0A6G0HSL8_LARCR|nr:Tektin-2 [Larimichthys crocea]